MDCARLFRRLAPLVAAALLSAGCSLARPTQATFGEPLPVPAIPAVVSVAIDGAQRFQTIDGFGANINGTYWNDGAMAPALDALAAELGATIFRVIVETSYWESANDNADPLSFDWAAYNTVYAGPEFRSLFAIMRHLTQKDGAHVVLNVMGPAPAWMGDGRVDTSAEDEWVEMIASLLVYARDEEGLAIELLAPMNEMDLGDPEGPKMEPRQYARMLRKLAERLDALDLGAVRLVVPDLAFSSSARAFIPPLLADELVAAKIATFSIHDYGGDIVDVPALIGAERYAAGGFWVTEYSQWCVDCDSSAETAGKWVFGADTASFLLRYLERGATAALVYDGLDGFYVHHGTFDYWGVLAYDPATGDFAPRPRFGATAQIFRFVRPGMVRVAVDASAQGLSLLAFSDPASGALSIVGRNPTDHPVTIEATLLGLEPAGPLALTQTTAAASLAPGGPVPLRDGQLRVEVAADSVFAVSTLRP